MVIYNTLQNFTDASNQTDLGTMFYYGNTVVPNLMTIIILFPLFIIVLLSTYFGSKRATGRGDIFASFASASFVDVIVATLLSLTNPPLISSGTLITTIAIFIASAIILILTRD